MHRINYMLYSLFIADLSLKISNTKKNACAERLQVCLQKCASRKSAGVRAPLGIALDAAYLQHTTIYSRSMPIQLYVCKLVTGLFAPVVSVMQSKTVHIFSTYISLYVFTCRRIL